MATPEKRSTEARKCEKCRTITQHEGRIVLGRVALEQLGRRVRGMVRAAGCGTAEPLPNWVRGSIPGRLVW